MPTNLLILPLLAGFWFVHNCYYFRFRSQRLDGYRLLLESALAGVGLTLIARCAVLFVRLFPIGADIERSWHLFSPIPFSGTAACAIIAGVVSSYAVNLAFIGGREAARNYAVERHGHDLFRLINDALNRKHLVSVTLRNRKWYVGYVTRAPNLNPQELFVSILPVFSGYRDQGTMEAVATTDYMPVYDRGVDRNDFLITFPMEDIAVASLFDQSIFQEFFAASEQARAQLDETNAS